MQRAVAGGSEEARTLAARLTAAETRRSVRQGPLVAVGRGRPPAAPRSSHAPATASVHRPGVEYDNVTSPFSREGTHGVFNGAISAQTKCPSGR